MSKEYSILKDEKSVHVTCIRPYANCALFNSYRDLVNISTTKTITRDGVLVYTFNLRGTDAEIKECMPTVCDLTRQICDQCQSKRLRIAARELVKHKQK